MQTNKNLKNFSNKLIIKKLDLKFLAENITQKKNIDIYLNYFYKNLYI